jgi:putative two-component system response regulator
VQEATVNPKQSARILVVDDDPRICELVCRWLEREGHSCSSTESGESAIRLLRQERFELVITDIMMPGMSGVDLLTYVKSQFPETAVLMLTAVDDRSTALMTFELGAYGYILKPFHGDDILLHVAGALERRRLMLMSRSYERDLEKRIRDKDVEVQSLERELVHRLNSTADSHRDETRAHGKRVGIVAGLIARHLRWTPESVERMKLAAQLHDLGKIGIPDAILLKRGPLSFEETEILKKHTVIGAQILDRSEFPLLRMARDIAHAHHERWDGGGYPQGLCRQYIPESARIVAIADTYDILTHRSVNRPAMSEERALAIMNAYRDSAFDARIFDLFMALIPAIREIQQEVGDEEDFLCWM